jgi:peptidoglycan/xylan/chitin deacetylase (PgdA/CDA1 family)
VITVDDGYRDFFLNAYPVFREFNVPVLVYLVSGFLDRKIWMWWDQLEYAFERTPRETLKYTLRSGDFVAGPFDSLQQRREVAECFANRLKEVSNSERLEAIAGTLEMLNVSLPAQPPPQMEAMSWDDVRDAARNGIEFGAHTQTHPILSTLQDTVALQEEIAGSKRRVEEELGAPCIHFCYPNGRMRDIGPRARSIVEDSGFQTAVTTERGLNSRRQDPLLLRRLSAEPTLPSPYFKEMLAGLPKN